MYMADMPNLILKRSRQITLKGSAWSQGAEAQCIDCATLGAETDYGRKRTGRQLALACLGKSWDPSSGSSVYSGPLRRLQLLQASRQSQGHVPLGAQGCIAGHMARSANNLWCTRTLVMLSGESLYGANFGVAAPLSPNLVSFASQSVSR
jgi:hypothetical protein